MNFIDFNGENAQRPDDNQQAPINRNDLLKAQQLVAKKNEIATSILSNQGVPVNANTIGAASASLNITATYSEKPVLGENGPRVDNSTEPQIETLTLRGLNLPGEASNTERNREVAMDVTGFVVGEAVQIGMEQVLEKRFKLGLGILFRASNTAGHVLSSFETGMGASPAAGDKARNEMQQQQARQAVIDWFNELNKQNQ